MEATLNVLQYALERTFSLLPWFLLAIVLGCLLMHLRMDVLTSGGFTRRTGVAVLTTTIFGSLTPFCACAIVPIIRGFLRAGLPLAVAMTLWVTSPALSPEILGLTAAAFGWKVAIARLVGAMALGIASAYLAHVLVRRGWLPQILREEKPKTAASACCADSAAGGAPSEGSAFRVSPAPAVVASSPVFLANAAQPATAGATATMVASPALNGNGSGAASRVAEPEPDAMGSAGTVVFGGPTTKRRWWPQAREELQSVSVWEFGRSLRADSWFLGKWMLLAILIEALIVQFVTPNSFQSLLGGELLVSIAAAALLSIPLYLNGISAIPIGAALVSMGMSPAGLTTFLLAGAITTIPAMAAVRAIVTTRVFCLYAGTGVFGSMLVGLAAAPFVN